MSVRSYDRDEAPLAVLQYAEDLAIHTVQVTGNEKVFPKRHRWQLSGRIVDSSLAICQNLTRANAVRVENGDDWKLRRGYQQSAAIELDDLLMLMRLSWKALGVPLERIKAWAQLARKCKLALQSWRKADSVRYAQQDTQVAD